MVLVSSLSSKMEFTYMFLVPFQSLNELFWDWLPYAVYMLSFDTVSLS